MKATNNTAERAGRWVGSVWWAILRQDARARRWLIDRGMPTPVAGSVGWVFKLVVLGILLYAAFWLVVLIVVTAVAAWIARNSDVRVDEATSEWRYGLLGFGLYNREGHRIDPHSFDND